jgi:hypothetical protein
MNREDKLEWLVKYHDSGVNQKPFKDTPPSHGWSFQDNKYIHPDYDPITIDDWNRAKIVPNTQIRILSTEHSEYVQKLAFEAGFSWLGDKVTQYTSEIALFFWSDYYICHDDHHRSFNNPKDYRKEIFIEMPALKDELTAMEVIRDTARLVNARINARVLAEKVGTKHDQGKPRYDLIPVHAEAEVVDVLTFGATKYAPNQWRNVEGARERYTAATMRHIAAYRMGETHDQESGKHHLAHAICCMAFIIELDLEKE